MSETNHAMNIGSPRVLSPRRSRNSRAPSATYAGHQDTDSTVHRPHDPDDELGPNVESLYRDDGNDFNVDPNAPVLSAVVGEETIQEVERQRVTEEQERREKNAARAQAGAGNRFVGGFVLGLKNALRPRWGGGSPQRQARPPRDPYSAFPHAVYDPEPDSEDGGAEWHARERGHDPRDIEYQAGLDRQEFDKHHRTSYESTDSPSETVHPTTEWHDDGTTAVDHSGNPLSQYQGARDAYGNPIPPPQRMQQDVRVHQNNPNPDNFVPSYVQSHSNYIPANSTGLYNFSVGSPIVADIQPAPDYAKMDIPPSTAPSDVSFNTYLSRIRQVIEHVNSLPWVAERVTVDYYPAGIRREKIEKKERNRERLKRQDEEKLGPGGLFGDGRGIGRKDKRPIVSWYDRNRVGLPTSNPGDLDLTAGSPPLPVQMQPSMAQTMTENAEGVTPYSPLAPAAVPQVATSAFTTTSSRPGDVPLAPGLYPSANAETTAPLVPVSSDDPYSYAEGATPGGAGTTVRLSSPPVTTVLPTTTTIQHPPESHVPAAGMSARGPSTTPGGEPVSINVLPPSTPASMPSASAGIQNLTGLTPNSGVEPAPGAVIPPFIPEPAAVHSPTRSATHTRAPSAPDHGTPMTARVPTSPAPPSQTHSRTPSRTHERPGVTGAYNRRRNPNTPVHYFPANANVPVTSAPPRTPAPTAPPTPAHSPNATPAQHGAGHNQAPVIPTARQYSHSGLSEGGVSDKSGISGRSGRSWVVVNGRATPSSTASNDTRDDRSFAVGTPYIPTRVNSVAATPRMTGRRDTMETAPYTPVSANPSSQFQTPIVSMYASSGHGGKGKGKAPAMAASVQTVSDSEDGSPSSARKAYKQQKRIYEDLQREHHRTMERERAQGRNPSYAMGMNFYSNPRPRQP